MAKSTNLAQAFAAGPPVLEVALGEAVQRLAVEQLLPDPNNPRSDLGDLESMAASLSQQGILEPLIARPGETPGVYIIVVGHRRHAAAQLAGVPDVPVVIREMTAEQAQEAMLVENLHRLDLTPLGEAQAYQRLIELGYSQHQLAQRVSRSQAHVSRRLSLLKLPEEATTELAEGRLRIEDALELTKLADMPKRQAAAIKSAKQWGRGEGLGNVHNAVASQLRDHEEAEKRGKAKQQLKKDGVKVVELDSQYGMSLYGRKERYLAGQPNTGYGYSIELTVDQHKDEACHRGAVTRDGEIQYLCVDPSRHAQKGSSKVKVPKKKREVDDFEKKRREQEKARTAANVARREFVAGPQVLGVRRNPAEELQRWALSALLVSCQADAFLVAARMLGLEAPNGYGAESALEAAVANDGKQLPKVLLALSLANMEVRVAHPWPSKKALRTEYFTWLIERGHRLSEIELHDLGEEFSQQPAAVEDPDPDVPDHRTDPEAYEVAYQALPAGDERARWARVKARRTREAGSAATQAAVVDGGEA